MYFPNSPLSIDLNPHHRDWLPSIPSCLHCPNRNRAGDPIHPMVEMSFIHLQASGPVHVILHTAEPPSFNRRGHLFQFDRFFIPFRYDEHLVFRESVVIPTPGCVALPILDHPRDHVMPPHSHIHPPYIDPGRHSYPSLHPSLAWGPVTNLAHPLHLRLGTHTENSHWKRSAIDVTHLLQPV